MPRPRFAKLDSSRRQEILETAAEEFAAHGYDGASLNHVIDRLGMSKGSFYYYFDDKADLFAAVLEMAWSVMLPEDEFDVASLDGRTFWPSLKAMLDAMRALVRERPWLIGVSRLFYHPPDDRRVVELVAAKLGQAHAWQEALLLRGQELGAVRADLPRELLITAVAAMDEAVDRWMLDNWERVGTDEMERILEVFFAVLRRMLEPPVSGPGTGGDR